MGLLSVRKKDWREDMSTLFFEIKWSFGAKFMTIWNFQVEAYGCRYQILLSYLMPA